jgi:two-component system OmpR family response regulator
VDDDRRMARTLTDILTVKGYEALAAHSGEEGLEKLARQRVHAVLCDVCLADMDGALFADLVRRTLPFLPIILLTRLYAGGNPAQRADGRVHGGLAQAAGCQSSAQFLRLAGQNQPFHPCG